MNVTRKSSYGLIAAIELARCGPDDPRSASSIANQYELPTPFMEKILHELRKAGLVRSKQGCAGGYYLAHPAERVSVRDVLEALGESLDLVRCLGTPSECSLGSACPTQAAWRHVDTRLKSLLDSMSLRSLLDSKSPPNP
jgi:Rrf2 family protein